MQCIDSLAGVKVAEEMYLTDNGEYTVDMDQLTYYMIAGCKDKGGIDCPGEVEEMLDRNCFGRSIKGIKKGSKYIDYQITGTSKYKTKCRICVTPAGYLPTSYTEGCRSGKESVITCPAAVKSAVTQ